MQYLNLDLKIQPASSGLYAVVAHSDAGDGQMLVRFPFDSAALESVLLRVQNALLRAAMPHRQVLSPEDQAVQAFGQRLFESVLAGEVLRLYEASGALADRQRKGLRVRLQVLAPELATLPWEFLYDPRQGEYLCFLPNRLVIRYLDLPQPPQAVSVELPLLVLAMVASPSNLDPLNVDYERKRLIDALTPLEKRGALKLRWVQGQTWRDLQGALWQRNWHIIHFIGHGGFDQRSQEGVLALADEQGKAHLLGATDLGRLLSQRQSLRLVVLNACQGAMGNKTDLFSSTAATLARRGIPAVLAMQYDITDQAAIELTRGFYGALAAGIPVDESVTQARTSISLGKSRTLEWATPVLYMRAPDGVLFDLQPLTTFVAPPGSQPAAPPSATGKPTAPSATAKPPTSPATAKPPAQPTAPPSTSGPSTAPSGSSAPPSWQQSAGGYASAPGSQQPAGGYGSVSGPPRVPAYLPESPPLVSVPPRKRGGAGRGLAIGLVVILLIVVCGGVGFGVFKLGSGISLPGLPGSGNSTAHFHVIPSTLAPGDCTTNSVDPQYNCQVTLMNESAQQSLNWTAVSSDSRITLSNYSNFLDPNGSWPVEVIVPKSVCPTSATITFTGPVNTATVSWSC
jgi:CHAT domain-containing protein